MMFTREIIMNRKFFQVPALLILLAGAASLSAQQSAPSAVNKPAQPKEDWSALPIASSGLDVSRMQVSQIARWDKEEYTEELLRAQWRPNDPIDLYVVLPKSTEKVPAILYLYDFSNDTERFRNESWCRRMTRGGFAAVGFVSAVSADRIHAPRPMKSWFVGELQEGLGTTTHDVQMILNYLAQRGDIDMSRIGMFGQGSGASIAVLAAAADPRITTLDLFDLWGDWPEWLKQSPIIPQEQRANYVTPQFLDKVAKLDPVKYLPQLESRKVRIEYVVDDANMPSSVRSALLTAAPKNANILRYNDEAEHIDEWHANGLSGWIKGQLKPSWSEPPIDSPAPGQASEQR